jgi:outer membrane receptor for ferrienterochelin and colicins
MVKGLFLLYLGLSTALFGVAPVPNQTDAGLDSLFQIEIEQNTDQTQTASKYVQSTSEAPSSITIITSEQIEQYGYTTLAEALNDVRSFFLTQDRMYSYLGTRGFSRLGDYNNRILLLWNGHRLNENIFSSALIGSELAVDLGSVERIEIIRGPGSSLYGSNALFAVINIIPKDARTFSGFRATAEAGTWGRKTGSLAFAGEVRDVRVAASATLAKSAGQDLYFPERNAPPESDGWARNLDGERWNGFNASLSTGRFRLQGFWGSRTKDFPTAAYGVAFNAPGAKVRDDRAFLEGVWENELAANLSAQVKASYDAYAYKGWYPETAVYRYYDKAIGQWFGVEGQLIWDYRPDSRLTFGGEYRDDLKNRYVIWDDTETFTSITNPNSIASLYLENEYTPWRQLKLVAGCRWDRNSVFGSRLSPRGALVWMPNTASTVKCVAGTAFRNPDLYESVYEDPNSNAIGNPDIKLESIKTLEMIWEQKWIRNALSSFFVLYRYDMKDLIEQVAIDNPDDPENPFSQFQNRENVNARGFELELDATLARHAKGFVSYGYQQGKDEITGEKLANSPQHLFKCGVGFDFLKAFSFGATVVRESGRKTLGDSATEPFWLANANLRARIGGCAALSVRFNNLFDERFAYPAGLDHDPIQTITQNGRNVILRLDLTR